MSVRVRGQINRHLPFSLVDGPGNRFVLFLQGCNFDCVTCHNPQTIARSASLSTPLSVDEIVKQIRECADYISGITVSGGEPTLQVEFVRALFDEIKGDPELAHLTTFVDSNGAAPRRSWDLLRPVMDGAMIDLKALNPAVHMALTSRPNESVLGSIKYLADIGLLYEVRLLIVPGFNDSEDAVRHTAKWLQSVDPELPLKLIGFRKHGTRPETVVLDEPDSATMDLIAEQYRAEGMKEIVVI
ncbi:MAG: radical SAM protein [Acidimicrobiales bacterium]